VRIGILTIGVKFAGALGLKHPSEKFNGHFLVYTGLSLRSTSNQERLNHLAGISPNVTFATRGGGGGTVVRTV